MRGEREGGGGGERECWGRSHKEDQKGKMGGGVGVCFVVFMICCALTDISAINLLPAKNHPRTVFGLLKIFPGQVLASAHFVLECWDKLAAGKCPGMNNFWSYGINIFCKFQVCPRADTF